MAVAPQQPPQRATSATGAKGSTEGPLYAAVGSSAALLADGSDPSRRHTARQVFTAAALSAAGLVAVAATLVAMRRNGTGAGGASSGAPLLRSGFTGHLEGKSAEFGYVRFAPPFDSTREECGSTDDGYDYNLTAIETLFNVGSSTMCCAACEAFPACGAWTWGKAPHTDWLTQVCWLKELQPGSLPVKLPKDSVISGLPAQGVLKQGVRPPPPSQTQLLDGIVPKTTDVNLAITGQQTSIDGTEDSFPGAASGNKFFGKCPGSIFVEGHGPVTLVNAGADTPGKPSGRVEALKGDLVAPYMSGRTYFGKSCAEGDYDPQVYSSINLLAKRMSWTTDVSGTGCGCNAAFYLVSMPQNTKIGTCQDYYCDAMHVCGVSCAEIDMQEANQYSWMSTMHAYNPTVGADGLGMARGYGGSLGEPERRDWTATEYGPGGQCIDTQAPFQVSVSFPMTGNGTLAAMEIELSQAGKPCNLNSRIDEYAVQGHEAMQELTDALQAGMTPVISYWKSKDMLWMDGLGADGRGPCVKDTPDMCPDHVRFYGFSISSL
mmetsp:Transcript_22026/g.55611  ORF Transcript_22026/g.55611 Transcript_22026/m.55611 type:complete len:547 (-) Transcript_22026:125-1765(-)